MKIKDYFSNAKKHLSVINRHRKEVRRNCFRCGLYKQGLLHDLSKYSWTEFSKGVIYFQGDRSPNDAEREAKGYTSAWLHHKGRNKHHLEYWVDYDVKKSAAGMVGMKMPDNYIIEMFCDRVAASKIYQGDKYTDASPLQYYEKGKGKYILHPYVKNKLELLLTMLAEKGEKYTFAYAHKWVKEYKKRQKKSCCCKCCTCGGCGCKS